MSDYFSGREYTEWPEPASTSLSLVFAVFFTVTVMGYGKTPPSAQDDHG